MDHQTFRTSAQQWISGFDTQARRAIAGWRTGGDRLGDAARARWDQAYEQSSPKLSEETRRNASHARDVFARCYGKGVDLSATGAEVAVDTVVQAARIAVARAADWQQRRA
jgi:hypothetical protein